MNSATLDRASMLDEEETWLQDVAVQIAESGPTGVRFLITSIDNASEWRMRAILLGLSAVKKPTPRLRKEICEIGLRFLQDDRPLIVAEAIDLLNRLGCTDERDTIVQLTSHTSPFVVGSVLRYLAQHDREAAIPLLEKALTSRQSIIRQNAVDELDNLNCRQSLAAIRRLIRDSNRDVRQAARTAVKNLTAQHAKTKRRAKSRT